MENQNDQVLVTRKTELTSAQKAGYLFAGLLGGAGCLGDAENARKWRRAELEELDRQYREGEPLTGCGIALQ